MPIDLGRTVRELAEAALREAAQPEPKKSKKAKKPFLSTGRAMLLGAGLMTAGRALAGSRGRHMLDSLHEFLEEQHEPRGDEQPPDFEDEETLAEEDEEFEDEEPVAEEDEDFEDEEPEAEEDEDFQDEEPEAEEDEDFQDEEPEEPEDEEPEEPEAEEPDPEPEESEEPRPKPRRRSASRGRT